MSDEKARAACLFGVVVAIFVSLTTILLNTSNNDTIVRTTAITNGYSQSMEPGSTSLSWVKR